MNQLTLNLENIQVTLPDSLVVVNKEEYTTLQEKAAKGRYMTLKEVLELLSVSRPWLIEHVLYNPSWRQKLDIDLNSEGFVKYPKSQGGKYLFLASQTRDFFEQHFSEILAEK